MVEIVCEVESQCLLGEGPLWDPRHNCVWWVDILAGHLHRLDLASRDHTQRALPVALTAIGLKDDGGYVGTIWDRFVLLDDDMNIVEALAPAEPNQPENRFNDGKVDAHGRFWAGTMHADLKAPTGKLYQLNAGQVSMHDSGYTVTNGPTFSLDGQTLYHTSTMDRQIFAFDLDEAGQLSNKRLHIEISEDEGVPDGMTVDNDGNLWVAHYLGARITKFAPDGTKITHIDLPALNITSLTFGGPDLDRFYVTTAIGDLSEQDIKERYPMSGALLSFDPGVTGPEPYQYRSASA